MWDCMWDCTWTAGALRPRRAAATGRGASGGRARHLARCGGRRGGRRQQCWRHAEPQGGARRAAPELGRRRRRRRRRQRRRRGRRLASSDLSVGLGEGRGRGAGHRPAQPGQGVRHGGLRRARDTDGAALDQRQHRLAAAQHDEAARAPCTSRGGGDARGVARRRSGGAARGRLPRARLRLLGAAPRCVDGLAPAPRGTAAGTGRPRPPLRLRPERARVRGTRRQRAVRRGPAAPLALPRRSRGARVAHA